MNYNFLNKEYIWRKSSNKKNTEKGICTTRENFNCDIIDSIKKMEKARDSLVKLIKEITKRRVLVSKTQNDKKNINESFNNLCRYALNSKLLTKDMIYTAKGKVIYKSKIKFFFYSSKCWVNHFFVCSFQRISSVAQWLRSGYKQLAATFLEKDS